MYHLKIKSELQNRIDAEYYSPAALEAEKAVRSFGKYRTFGSLVSEGYRVVYHGIDSVNHLSPQERALFLSPSDVTDDGEVLFSDLAEVPISYHQRYPKGLAKAGELLIEVKGNVSKLAVVPDRFPPGLLVSGSFYKATLHPTADTRFVLSFLHTQVGQALKERLTSNSIINYVAKEDLYSIPIPLPDEQVQTYIGDKVRQAERLRERAQELEKAFQTAIQESYPDIFGPVQSRGKHSRVQVSSLDATLKPGAFNPERLRIRDAIRARGGKLVRSLADVTTPVASQYRSDDPYIGLDAISSNSCSVAPSTIAADEITGTVRVLAEGPVISKLRPYLNKVAYIPRELSGVYGSTELLCLRPKQGVSGWYMYGVLKLESTIRQLNPVATGATHPRVSRDDVLDVMVPVVDGAEAGGEQLGVAQAAYFASERLTIAAKLLVEALIEGKLSEMELKAAQEALERGDRSLDREILARLTRKGIDVKDEPPLFADLDALYQALDESHSQMKVAGV